MNKGVFQMKKQTWKSIFLSLIAIFTLFLRITLEHKGDKAISNQTTTTILLQRGGSYERSIKGNDR